MTETQVVEKEPVKPVRVVVRNNSRARGNHYLTDTVAGTVEFKAGEVKTLDISPACADELKRWTDSKRGDLEVLSGKQAARALAYQEEVDAKEERAARAAEAARKAQAEAEAAQAELADDDEPEAESTPEEVAEAQKENEEDLKRVAERVKTRRS